MTILKNKAFRILLYTIGYLAAVGVFVFAALAGLRYTVFQNDIETANNYAETSAIRGGVMEELLALQNKAESKQALAEADLENAVLDLLDYATGVRREVPLSELDPNSDVLSGLRSSADLWNGDPDDPLSYYDNNNASGAFLSIRPDDYIRLITENCQIYSSDLQQLYLNSPERLSGEQRDIYSKLLESSLTDMLEDGDYFLILDDGIFSYSPSYNMIRQGSHTIWPGESGNGAAQDALYISLPKGWSEKDLLSEPKTAEALKDILGGTIFNSPYTACYASLDENDRSLIRENRYDDPIIIGANTAVSFGGDEIYSSKLIDRSALPGYATEDSYKKLADAILAGADVCVRYDHTNGTLEQWYKDSDGNRHDFSYITDPEALSGLTKGDFILGLPLRHGIMRASSFNDLAFTACKAVPNPLLFLILCAVIFLLCVIFILIGTPAKLRVTDKIPFELFVIGYLILMFILAFWIPRTIGGEAFVLVENDLAAACVAFLLLVLALYLVNAGLFTTITRRLKCKSFVKTLLTPVLVTLVIRGIKALAGRIRKGFARLADNYAKSVRGHKRLIIFGSVLFGIHALVLLFLILFLGLSHFEAAIFFLILLAAEAFAGWHLLKYSAGVEKVLLVSRRIESGELDARTDVDDLQYNVKELGESLNHVGSGLSSAVDASIRDERTKAELITNVSHDIKTPLTSIISYVDLLKKEPAGSEKAAEYIEILDKKSQRLKQLIMDLIEVSKTGTGNIELDCMNLDLAELLDQSLGEYEEKFAACRLEVVKTSRPGSVIYADGRRIFRIIDNLLNNVVKYAQPATRVYIDLEQTEEDGAGRISLSVKNVSREMLNISAGELSERFVRGDRSRHTEGSGLGLSIAKNLTELQGGRFEIFIDGDLFKARISFPAASQ